MKNYCLIFVITYLLVRKIRVVAEEHTVELKWDHKHCPPLRIVIEHIVPNCDIEYNVIDHKNHVDPVKAENCAKAPCELIDDGDVAICACNHRNGKVASFRSRCDLKRHNCRYDTDFAEMLVGICPWEYQSRRSLTPQFNYNQTKYFN